MVWVGWSSVALWLSRPPCLDDRQARHPRPRVACQVGVQGSVCGCEAAGVAISTHCMETVETAEGILPMPPLSTSSIACFISILW